MVRAKNIKHEHLYLHGFVVCLCTNEKMFWRVKGSCCITQHAHALFIMTDASFADSTYVCLWTGVDGVGLLLV